MTPRERFLGLDDDVDRWRYLIQLDKSLFKILLDNDETYVQFEETAREVVNTDDEDCVFGRRMEYAWDDFSGTVGNDIGAIDLLIALGINVEGV